MFGRLPICITLLIILAGCPFYSFAQGGFTNVSAQVIDPSGNPYSNCSYNVDFIGQAVGATVPYTVGGTSPFQQSFGGAKCDSSGNLAIRIADNLQITPTPSQWKFSICNSSGLTCFNTIITITGNNQVVTANLQAAAIPLTATNACTAISLTGIVCVASPPYYASGSSSTTTTSGSTSAGTTINVASCSTFSPHQGVYIAGAGAAGANYIGTVSACAGTVMIVTPSTSTTVANGTLVQHDDTTAIQSAMQAAVDAGGGKLSFPPGFYRVNGPHQDTGHSQANSVLLVPLVGQVNNPPPTPVTIVLEGPIPPSGVAMETATNTYGGTVIQTDKTGGNLLGAYNVASVVYGPFTNVKLILNNLRFTTYDNPNEGVLSLYYLNSVGGDNIQIDTGKSHTCSPSCITFPPTHTNAVAIEFPGVNTSPLDGIHNLQISGYYIGSTLHEHSHIENVYYSFTAFPIDVETPFAASIVKATVDVCTNAVTGTGPIVIGLITADQCTYMVSDVGNLLTGSIFYKKGNGFTAALNGAANLFTYDIGAVPDITTKTIHASSQITSTLATGTAPIATSSTTPAIGLVACPTTYDHSGGQATGCHIVRDSCTLGTSCVVTFASGAVFTNANSYECNANDADAIAAVRVNQIDGSHVTFTGTGTDGIRYTCSGN